MSHRLIRAYWYNASSMRPFEPSISAADKVVNNYQGKYAELSAEMVLRLAENWYIEQRRHFEQTKDQVFEKIQRQTDFLEFKYIGEFVLKPFKCLKLEKQIDGTFIYQGTREGEKGVDVGIAVDMMSKMTEFDVAILVSGDADFIPIVRYLKDHLKYVYQFSLARGIPPKIQYLSPWLTGCVDISSGYNELELLEVYLARKAKSISPGVMASIDQRIEELRVSSQSITGDLVFR